MIQSPPRGSFTPAGLLLRRSLSRPLLGPRLVAFIAYTLHVCLRQHCRKAAGGLTPRAVLEKFSALQMIDVHLPCTDGRKVILSRYTQPEKILLESAKSG